MRDDSYSKIVYKLFYKENPELNCPDITIQVTDDCCLQCSYCYQIHKDHHMMSNEIMKSIIDLLFKMYDEDNPAALINHNTKGIVLKFIGGEPFMNIDVIDYGSTYFLDECIKRDHPWLLYFRFSIISNGILYFTPKVQAYIKKFEPFLSLGITIDGPEELHDACRKYADGSGSFDKAFAAFQDCIKTKEYVSTKVTIAPENLPYLSSIIDFFRDLGCNGVVASPIYEHKWTIKEAQLYYIELKKIAELLFKYPDFEFSGFSPAFGLPMLSSENNNWCGGMGQMLAFDYEGKAYPCIRYMESSLGSSYPPLIIGDYTGVYNSEETQNLLKELKAVTRRSQSSDECFNCPIAFGCGWCSAWNYQENGTVDKRSTNQCWMHRARSLANSYYQNKIFEQTGNNKRLPVYLNREIATQIISDEEYDNLLKLANNLR